MRPKKPKNQPQDQLFQIRLDVICDSANSLAKLADRIDWDNLDEQFAVLYSAEGRPAIATRMMVGLTLLQSLYSLSEDDVVNRWSENPSGSTCAGKHSFSISHPLLVAD